MSVAKEANLASKEGWDKVINIIPLWTSSRDKPTTKPIEHSVDFRGRIYST
jgi:hypothetical protein